MRDRMFFASVWMLSLMVGCVAEPVDSTTGHVAQGVKSLPVAVADLGVPDPKALPADLGVLNAKAPPDDPAVVAPDLAKPVDLATPVDQAIAADDLDAGADSGVADGGLPDALQALLAQLAAQGQSPLDYLVPLQGQGQGQGQGKLPGSCSDDASSDGGADADALPDTEDEPYPPYEVEVEVEGVDGGESNVLLQAGPLAGQVLPCGVATAGVGGVTGGICRLNGTVTCTRVVACVNVFAAPPRCNQACPLPTATTRTARLPLAFALPIPAAAKFALCVALGPAAIAARCALASPTMAGVRDGPVCRRPPLPAATVTCR